MPAKIKLRLMTDGDRPETIKVYNRVFRANVSADYWRWKYAPPAGSFAIVAVNDQEKIVGHYGTQIKRGIYFGQEKRFFNIVDVGILENYRGQNFLIKSLSYQRATGLYQPDDFAYDWPREIVQTIIDKYSFYDGLMPINIYCKKLTALKMTEKLIPLIDKKIKIIRLNSIKFASNLNQLWSIKKNELGVSLIRDWPLIEWYTIKHPGKNALFGIFLNHQTIGYFSLMIKNKICYITDILILNDYATAHILTLIENQCQNCQVDEIRILINNRRLEQIINQDNYQVQHDIKLCYFGGGEKINREDFYVTYLDTDIF